MIKRTLYFGNPAYLKTTDEQMVVQLQEPEQQLKSIPIEDVGLVLLDNPQITITHGLIAKLLHYNAAIITCNDAHHPTGLMLNLDGNSLQSQKFKAQLESSIPLRKQLWQQTVTAKIINQATVLKLKNADNHYLINLSKTVSSGDSSNIEARAASYYWKRVFTGLQNFTRERYGMPPNNYLNYGYAILRAIVARSLVGSGLLPTLGIHHRNQYNAYCLADDIMEPYRPLVDLLVDKTFKESEYSVELFPGIKKQLLSIPAMDVILNGEKSPLMNAVQRTTASLSKCFEGSAKKILYPTLVK